MWSSMGESGPPFRSTARRQAPVHITLQHGPVRLIEGQRVAFAANRQGGGADEPPEMPVGFRVPRALAVLVINIAGDDIGKLLAGDDIAGRQDVTSEPLL